MKHIITLTLTLCLMLSLCAIGAAAEEQTTVFVTIASKGTLEAVQVAVPVEDVDGDCVLTVNDALYIAHQNLYNGGAEAGYAYYTGDYGLSMSKLWGDESGSYGYYLNNTSCISLAAPVKDGDYVTAFVYASADWSDIYTCFDINCTAAEAGQTVTLTLNAAGYDANWNPITYPVEGATVTINGTATEYVTDAEGKVTLNVTEAGTLIISATSSTMTLVPPVCTLTVSATETEATSATITEATTETEAVQEVTGCKATACGALVLVALIGCAMIPRKEN